MTVFLSLLVLPELFWKMKGAVKAYVIHVELIDRVFNIMKGTSCYGLCYTCKTDRQVVYHNGQW